MARIINVEINGQFVKKDSKNAGVMGEGNVTTLHMTFDESWSGYGMRIVWRDANGENPVSVVLLEPGTVAEGENPIAFDTDIPAEPLALPGWCSFTVEGYKEEDGVHKVSLSVSDHLFVEQSDSYYKPAEPTPSEAQQIFEALGKTEENVKKSATEAKSWAVGGTGSRPGENTDNSKFYSDEAGKSATNAAESEKNAKGHKENAEKSAETANEAADKAEKASLHPPYIGTNWNWFVFDLESGTFKDSGVPAYGLIDQNSKKRIRMWFGTIQEYNMLTAIEPDVYYNILEGTP